MIEPFPKIRAGCDILQPQISFQPYFGHTPRPNSVHQDAKPIFFFDRVIYALQSNIYSRHKTSRSRFPSEYRCRKLLSGNRFLCASPQSPRPTYPERHNQPPRGGPYIKQSPILRLSSWESFPQGFPLSFHPIHKSQ